MTIYLRRIIYVVSLLKRNLKLVSILIVILIPISDSFYHHFQIKKSPEYLGVICRQPTFEGYQDASTHDLAEEVIEDISVARTVQVTLSDDMQFNPSYLEVEENETIHFVVKNIGKIKHEMVLGSKSDLVAHEREMLSSSDKSHKHIGMIHLNSGEAGSFNWKFKHTGEVSFACLQAGHYNAGMKGVVLVKARSGL